MAGSIARLAESDLDASERRRLLGRLAGQLRGRGVSDTFKPRAAMRWVADAVGDIVPHLPIRSRETLRQHFPGMTDDEIADRLVRNASRAAAAIGAAGGGIAAVEWVATPTLLTAPVLLASETVAVVAVEIKLIGELHEVYGVPIPGSVTQRGVGLDDRMGPSARRQSDDAGRGCGRGAQYGRPPRDARPAADGASDAT